MSKHTPGPWVAQLVGSNTFYIMRTSPAYHIALVSHESLSDEECGPNAALIAAAPELLKSLIELKHEIEINGIEEDSLCGPSIKAIRAMITRAGKAIAKARGEK